MSAQGTNVACNNTSISPSRSAASATLSNRFLIPSLYRHYVGSQPYLTIYTSSGSDPQCLVLAARAGPQPRPRDPSSPGPRAVHTGPPGTVRRRAIFLREHGTDHAHGVRAGLCGPAPGTGVSARVRGGQRVERALRCHSRRGRGGRQDKPCPLSPPLQGT
eukprot:580439-Rhodomonas_salina.2